MWASPPQPINSSRYVAALHVEVSAGERAPRKPWWRRRARPPSSALVVAPQAPPIDPSKLVLRILRADARDRGLAALFPNRRGGQPPCHDETRTDFSDCDLSFQVALPSKLFKPGSVLMPCQYTGSLAISLRFYKHRAIEVPASSFVLAAFHLSSGLKFPACSQHRTRGGGRSGGLNTRNSHQLLIG